MSDELWIVIPSWKRFQHADPEKRDYPWIKNYRSLTHDDNYRDLTMAQRGVLHGIWLEYSAAMPSNYNAQNSRNDRGDTAEIPWAYGGDTVGVPWALNADTARLTRRLGQRVTKQHLKALNHAGFIVLLASNPQATDKQDTSEAQAVARGLEERREEKKTKGLTQGPNETHANGAPESHDTELERLSAILDAVPADARTAWDIDDERTYDFGGDS